MSTPTKIDLEAYFPVKRLLFFALTVGKIVVLNSLKCMCNKINVINAITMSKTVFFKIFIIYL